MRYLLRNLDAATQETFPTLDAALARVGTVEEWELLDCTAGRRRNVSSREPSNASRRQRCSMPFKSAEDRRAYQRERRRLERAARTGASVSLSLPAEVRVQTARDVLDLIAEQINAVRQDRSLRSVERARTVGALMPARLLLDARLRGHDNRDCLGRP